MILLVNDAVLVPQDAEEKLTLEVNMKRLPDYLQDRKETLEKVGCGCALKMPRCFVLLLYVTVRYNVYSYFFVACQRTD